jgi:hypothetical protein
MSGSRAVGRSSSTKAPLTQARRPPLLHGACCWCPAEGGVGPPPGATPGARRRWSDCVAGWPGRPGRWAARWATHRGHDYRCVRIGGEGSSPHAWRCGQPPLGVESCAAGHPRARFRAQGSGHANASRSADCGRPDRFASGPTLSCDWKWCPPRPVEWHPAPRRRGSDTGRGDRRSGVHCMATQGRTRPLVCDCSRQRPFGENGVWLPVLPVSRGSTVSVTGDHGPHRRSPVVGPDPDEGFHLGAAHSARRHGVAHHGVRVAGHGGRHLGNKPPGVRVGEVAMGLRDVALVLGGGEAFGGDGDRLRAVGLGASAGHREAKVPWYRGGATNCVRGSATTGRPTTPVPIPPRVWEDRCCDEAR